MDALPTTWTALCALAFALGAKHGFDADHLATIDGLTRYNARRNPRLARYCGSLFSLGHGAVVMLVALAAGTLASRWDAPSWLEFTGIAVSIAFLFGLAFLNVHAVLTTHPQDVVRPAGLKGRLLGHILTVQSPWAVAGVGALFALSFDTVSQAALFALAAGHFGGVGHALFVAGIFVGGMLVVDGINGVWLARLIRRADRTAIVASRVLALSVAGLSLAVGLFTAAKLLVPGVDAWADGRELYFGGAVIAGVIVAFAAGMLAARRAAAARARRCAT
ncbi:MAG: nickel transporter [Betaproteobacteria bacterium]|jgi:high-affinity nickel-transport protein|nr:nickel transporter [Betaproteobacteria bacterium]